MKPERKNFAASVHDRLLNRSRERREDFSFVLHRYAAERFLYRLGLSTYREQFVLKGAMLFAVWSGSAYRATRDLDFTRYGDSEADAVLTCFRDICDLAVPDDALVFDSSTLTSELIRDDAEYNGLRVRLSATLGSGRIPLQIDVGFGNAIEPRPNNVEYPTLLDGPAPCIRAYPHEAVIAEKFHCMVRFGERNSRLKDFYDLYVVAHEFPFAGEQLTSAIAATFERRNTPIDPVQPVALAPRFYADTARTAQWRTYLQRNHLPSAPADFDSVGELIRQFLGPVWSALAENVTFASVWRPGGAWNSEDSENKILAAASGSASPTTHGQQHSHNADTVAVEDIEIPIATPLRRFKPYPAYKNSGVESLGEIPAHWEVYPLRRRLFREAGSIKIGPFGSQLKLEFMTLEGFKVYGQEHVIAHDFRRGNKYVDQAKFTELAGCEIRPNDLVVTMMGSSGHCAVVPQDIERGIMDSHLLRVRLPDCDLNPTYLCLLIDESVYVKDQIEASGKGAIMHGLNSSIIKSVVLAVPPSLEQQTILSFLNSETAKIDALVAKKERLIELLQEKRAALITWSVTKGLDPNVPMKDSGVEWLGEIPAHWEVKRLWHLTPSDRRIMYGIVLPGPNVDDGVPIVKGGDVSPEGLRLDRLNRTTKEIESGYVRSRLKGGDLVYAIRGSIGEVAIVPDDLEGANLTQDAARVAYTPASHGPWLLYALKAAAVFAQLEAGALGATIRGVNIRDLKRASIPVPPRVEQEAIAIFLHRETAKIDALLNRIREGIDRLNEFRTALISAAVTGKIDVRAEAA